MNKFKRYCEICGKSDEEDKILNVNNALDICETCILDCLEALINNLKIEGIIKEIDKSKENKK